MDYKRLGHKTIRLLYEDFKEHFNKGNIIIGGSFYYKRIGCDVYTEYKDVDIFVDNNKDEILHEILNYVELKYNPSSIFHKFYPSSGLIGSFTIDGYLSVDILRDDFSNLLPPIEIIPGVWSYELSYKASYDAYKKLSDILNNKKYKKIEEFFESKL